MNENIACDLNDCEEIMYLVLWSYFCLISDFFIAGEDKMLRVK